jgi:hypothetical protein
MPLDVRSISVSIAVICLFVISFVGWFSGLEPFTCCKRAVIGAIAAYFMVSFAVRFVNNILINALVKSRLEQQKGDVNGR